VQLLLQYYLIFKLFQGFRLNFHKKVVVTVYFFNRHLFLLYKRVTVITEEEWQVLSSSFKFDQAITVYKMTQQHEPAEATNHDPQRPIDDQELTSHSKTSSDTQHNTFQFDPEVCSLCMEQNALEKFLFDNKKIAIRQLDEEEVSAESIPNEAVVGEDADEATYLVCKKARLNSNLTDNSPGESVTRKERVDYEKAMTQISAGMYSGRRSKRSRKCKGDIEVYASSFDTVKKLKAQVTTNAKKYLGYESFFELLEKCKFIRVYIFYKTNIN